MERRSHHGRKQEVSIKSSNWDFIHAIRNKDSQFWENKSTMI